MESINILFGFIVVAKFNLILEHFNILMKN